MRVRQHLPAPKTALHWFSWRHSCHMMAPPRHPLYGAVLLVAQIGRHRLFSAFSHPGRIPPGQIFTFCISFKYTYPPDSYGTSPNTQEHFLFITMRSFHDLVSWPSSPLQGLMPSQKPLRQSRRDRGVSTYKATYWIQVQTKRTRSGLSSLGACLYSKKPNRPKQTSKLKKQQQEPFSLPPW